MTTITWLAVHATDKSGRLLADILPWLILLVGVIVIGGVAIYVIRRSLKDQLNGPSEGFTLQDLRDLHAAGELTNEQFERAKSMMIGRLKTRAAGKEPALDGSANEAQPGNDEQSSD